MGSLACGHPTKVWVSMTRRDRPTYLDCVYRELLVRENPPTFSYRWLTDWPEAGLLQLSSIAVQAKSLYGMAD